MCLHVYVCLCMYVHMDKDMYMYVCMMYVCMYVCMYDVCVFICLFVYFCACLCRVHLSPVMKNLFFCNCGNRASTLRTASKLSAAAASG